MKDDTTEKQGELRRFLSFTIANPDVPILVWFWGILIKSLMLLWLGYVTCRGIIILAEQGAPEAFLMVLLHATAATILYFLGDGLVHGERSALYGLGALSIIAVIIAVASAKLGYHIQMGILVSAICLLFLPPLFSGFRNIRLLT